VLARIAKSHLGLALIDSLTCSVPVIVTVSAHVSRAIREAAALAPGVHLIGAVVPAAKVFIEVTPLSFLASLDLCRLGRLSLELVAVLGAAQPANRRLDIAMHATEVTATDDTLGRWCSKAYSDWAFTS
jgi:hypothetical protein